MTRLYNGVRLLGNGPSLANIQKIDAGAMPMIASMASTGMQIDLDHFAKMEKQLDLDMDRITEEVYTLTGYRINLDSGDQVSDLLFKKMGLKQARVKMTTSGSRESVVDEVLTAICHDSPVVPLIQDYKEYSKLKGTYVKPMPKLARRVGKDDWRIFPNFRTTRVPSGRLSCNEPNLLAMPTRTDRGRDIRRGFIVHSGWTHVSVDESQIEVRLAAHSSGDPNLIRVYEEDEDVYSDSAIASFRLRDRRFKDSEGWHYPGVDRMAHRYPAKTCFLASIYDVSAAGLLEQMPVICSGCGLPAREHTCSKFVSLWTEAKSQDIINAFYMRYPGIMQDRKLHHSRARRYGYVWDMWGRLLHVAAVHSVLPWVVSGALRECGNFPYQAGAQGTIKLTMAHVWDWLVECKLLDIVHPLLQVHDELLFECVDWFADELIATVKEMFETCVQLKVPIKASGAKALTWGDLEK